MGAQHKHAALLIRLRQLPQAGAVLDKALRRVRAEAGTAGGGGAGRELLALEAET